LSLNVPQFQGVKKNFNVTFSFNNFFTIHL
jgi:hypothetical protein